MLMSFYDYYDFRENLVSDCFQGCFVVTCTLSAFISLVWLREQILHGRGPDWLDPEPDAVAPNQRQVWCHWIPRTI